MLPEPIPLPPDLTGAVTEVWALDMPRAHASEQVLPMPATEIIVNLAEPYRVYDDSGSWPTPAVFRTGLRRAVVRFDNPPVLRHVAVRLPAYGPARLGLEPTDTVGAVPGVLGDDLAGVAASGAHPADAARTVVEALRDHLAPETPEVRAVRVATDALLADPTRSIASLAADAGVTHKTLIARFRRVTGSTPSHLARLSAVDAVVRAIPTGGEVPSWTALIADSPFVDQSHFIRSFRQLVGLSPREYRDALARSRYDDPRFLDGEG